MPNIQHWYVIRCDPLHHKQTELLESDINFFLAQIISIPPVASSSYIQRFSSTTGPQTPSTYILQNKILSLTPIQNYRAEGPIT